MSARAGFRIGPLFISKSVTPLLFIVVALLIIGCCCGTYIIGGSLS